jgi:hypothetical protein
MDTRRDEVVTVVDGLIEQLKHRSVEMDHEVRASIYIFQNFVQCIVFDTDVMRLKSIRDYYKTDGMTALIDATMQAVKDHMYLPQMYGDHAFLLYAITDGQNNINNSGSISLRTTLSSLPDNWTVACLVPSPQCALDAKTFGFPAGSIGQWDINAVGGFEEAGRTVSTSLDNFLDMRNTGVKSTKGLFTMDSSRLKKTDLRRLSPRDYQVIHVRKDERIDKTVEMWTGQPYVTGSTYYEAIKPVIIQQQKRIIVMDRDTGHVYSGDDIRERLGLPAQTVKVNPGDHKKWRVMPQSTSQNRKVFKDTFLVVMKP